MKHTTYRSPLSIVRRWVKALALTAVARRSIALRAGAAMALTLGLGVWLGDVTSATLASQGCFAGLYGSQAPLRRRARVVAVVGLGLAASSALGTLVAGSPVLIIVVGGAYAALASLVALALRLGPPRELLFVLVYLIHAQLPASSGSLGTRAGLVLAGALVAWLITMGPALFRAKRAERLAARDALERSADLLAALGTPDVVTMRHHAILAVKTAVVAADDSGSRRAVASVARIERLLEAVMSLEVEDSAPVPAAWIELVRTLGAREAGTQADVPDSLEALPPLPALTSSLRVREALLCLLRGGEPDDSRDDATGLAGRGRWRSPDEWWVLRAPHPRVALRMGAMVALGLATGLVGLASPSWVAGAGAGVLQGAHARVIAGRMLNRALGTVLGVFVAEGFLNLALPSWGLVAIIAGLQLLVELIITSSYGLAVVVITPLVLLLAELAGARDPHALVGVRLVDTLAGCALAALVTLITRSWKPIGRLPSAQAAVLHAVSQVLEVAHAAPRSPAALVLARRGLQSALLDLRTAGEEVLGDALWSDPRADARWPITLQLERVAHLALTFPAELASGPVDAAALHGSLHAMARGLSARTQLGQPLPVALPSLPGLPRTSAALAELQLALRELGARRATDPA